MKYWLKIVSVAKPFYVNTVYHASQSRANLDSSYNWASKVKNCYVKMDMGMCGKIKVYMIQTHLCMYSDSD